MIDISKYFLRSKKHSMGRENLYLKDSVANLFYIALYVIYSYAYQLRQKQKFKLEKSISKVIY